MRLGKSDRLKRELHAPETGEAGTGPAQRTLPFLHGIEIPNDGESCLVVSNARSEPSTAHLGLRPGGGDALLPRLGSLPGGSRSRDRERPSPAEDAPVPEWRHGLVGGPLPVVVGPVSRREVVGVRRLARK